MWPSATGGLPWDLFLPGEPSNFELPTSPATGRIRAEVRMRTRLLTGVTVATLAVIVLSITDRADAQWPSYPWKNMPRTPDGKIDMKAAPRRMADGHIDLSGFWMPADVVRHLLNLASDLKP